VRVSTLDSLHLVPIDLLQARRTALISAVTGQIEVGAWHSRQLNHSC